jgi:hypothetical protein
LITGKEDETKANHVFFVRVEQPTTDNDRTRKTDVSRPPKMGPIVRLKGEAPFGIESRPFPAGTDLNVLLPKNVGPYDRVLLERTQQRGTAADSIKVDGDSVYATYRNGTKEVFVEFSIASTPEMAQSNWDVVVGDANEGIYPTDPRLGSFGTEPSYLKVVNDKGAFLAWTRGGYFITADAKSGEADLAAFMNAYPY